MESDPLGGTFWVFLLFHDSPAFSAQTEVGMEKMKSEGFAFSERHRIEETDAFEQENLCLPSPGKGSPERGRTWPFKGR
jgi:hypothetical protein